LSQKTLFNVFGSKSLEKVWKSSETGFLEHSEISEIVLFQNVQKLQKNDVKLELRKSQKTRSDLKTNSKVRLKVRNAGPSLPSYNSDEREHNQICFGRKKFFLFIRCIFAAFVL